MVGVDGTSTHMLSTEETRSTLQPWKDLQYLQRCRSFMALLLYVSGYKLLCSFIVSHQFKVTEL